MQKRRGRRMNTRRGRRVNMVTQRIGIILRTLRAFLSGLCGKTHPHPHTHLTINTDR